MGSLSLIQLLWVVSGVLFVTCDSFPSSELWALITFKEGIDEDPFQVLSSWNALDADPCDWFGISCSVAKEHVIKLNISGSSLRGFIAPELGQLSDLQKLILHGNNLIGTLPKEIVTLETLMVLDLGMNQLTGTIPPEIGNLKYLEELRLDMNRFTGTILGSNSSSFASIMRGMHPSSGNATGLCLTSKLRVANFSYNFFVGSIPKCLDYLPRGNCLQGQEPKQRVAAQCGATPPHKSHPIVGPKQEHAAYGYKHQGLSKPDWLLALKIVTGIMVGSLFLVALLTALHPFKGRSSISISWKKSVREKEDLTAYIDPEMLKDALRFSRQELEVACEDFSNIIGSFPDCLVYKGTLKGGPEIAVISLCINEEHWTGYLELYFQKEVVDLARLNHENTGKLLGYCRDSTPFTRMLVFEYASNGTLYEHLHCGDGYQLSWTRRMNIIIGIARGLSYLHTGFEPPFSISEFNSSAVYLTEDFSPKLVDFESWKTILARSENNSDSIQSEGAICLLSNSLEGRRLDVEGNIYSFGVLLLEIVSGRPPYCNDKGCLVDWAKNFLALPEVMCFVVDPELKYFRYNDLKVICEVVNLCINPDPIKRPSMLELCTILESSIDTSVSSQLKASSSLGWAGLSLSP
ncbi:probable LRR receptor-like serine/threonine-protein kinase At1g63430 isoform X2 [Malania oleifera]|uniref:probable LRR receptor-like serine/threonine-protein kinase At1g63430 isoform X2 n=1 Tax=Malania oleifera TaxID=397392 RepID=UPI0025AE13E0|nr:probable LRR receptor-like serine/threonine-protein kinase At1g63430 isoform X2 [Malania oleifera]